MSGARYAREVRVERCIFVIRRREFVINTMRLYTGSGRKRDWYIIMVYVSFKQLTDRAYSTGFMHADDRKVALPFVWGREDRTGLGRRFIRNENVPKIIINCNQHFGNFKP